MLKSFSLESFLNREHFFYFTIHADRYLNIELRLCRKRLEMRTIYCQLVSNKLFATSGFSRCEMENQVRSRS